MSVIGDIAKSNSDKLTALENGFATFKTDLEKTIADLAAKIGQPVAQADIDALNALGPRIDAITTGIQAEDTTVKQADQ